MSFWQVITLGGTMATILGLFLAFYAIYNNRTMKQEFRISRELLATIDQGQQEGFKSTRELLAKIDQGQQEARKEMAEAIKYLADLIRAEGDRTRQVIRTPS